MARNEQIVCDGCKKTWDLRDPENGAARHWHRFIKLSYAIEHGSFGGSTADALERELCDACASRVGHVLWCVTEFLQGEPLALSADVLAGKALATVRREVAAKEG